ISTDFGYDITDENGEYKIKNVRSGKIKLKVAKFGYKDALLTIYLSKETQKNDIKLTKEEYKVIDETTGMGEVFGIVEDKNNKPIDNASVLVNNEIVAMSNDSGYYSFQITTGAQEIELSKVGYGSVRIFLFVINGKNSIYFQMEEENKTIDFLSGVGELVCNTTSDDKKIASAFVSIIGNETEVCGLTDKDGKCIFENLKSGKLNISISKFGYKDILYITYLSANKTNDVYIKMVKDDENINKIDKATQYEATMTFCGVVTIIFSLYIILCGIFSIKRRNFGFVLLGALIALLLLVFILPLIPLAILVLFAVLLIYFSKREFR
ncbi:MAG: hypothetical protein AB1779_02950, partial [Candidatus Thermoplasmatota archaeon]